LNGQELYEFIKSDRELIDIVRQGLIIGRAHKSKRGRRPDPRRRATREFERFWSTRNALYFQLALEQKLGTDLAIRMMRGREARIRPVMILIVDEILRELESQEG
jgi:hypothetical protein